MLLIGAALMSARRARASVGGACPGAGRAIGDGSLPTGIDVADFGAIPEACVGDDASLRLRGTLLIAAAAPDFYGSVGVASTIRARFALGAHWQLAAAVDAATFRFAQNAVVSSSSVDAGPATVGLARAVIATPTFALTPFVRALLPLETARDGARFGGELGAAASAARDGGFGLQGGASAGVPAIVVRGQSHVSLRASAVVEAWAAGPRSSVTLGLFVRDQLAPSLPHTSSLGARAGGRFASRGGLWMAAVAEWPLVGGDRTDLVMSMFAGYTPAGSWRPRR